MYVRKWLSMAAAGFALAFSSPPSWAIDPVKCNFGADGKFRSEAEYAVYLLHKTSEKHKYFDDDCDGRLRPQDEAAYDKWLVEKIASSPEMRDYRRLAKAGALPKVPDAKTGGVQPLKPADGFSASPILRDSFADVSVFTAPKSVKLASGATFGVTRDDVTDNTSWSAKGLAGYVLTWQNPDNPVMKGRFDPYLTGYAFAPTVTFNRVTNSNFKLAGKDVNVLTLAATSEVAIGHLFDETSLHFVRARGAVVGDFDGEAKSWSAVLEYQPVTGFGDPRIPDIGSPNGVPGLPATYQIDLIMRVLYNERLAVITDPLFATRDSLFRVGPTVAFSIAPEQGPSSPVPELLQRFNFTTTYSWLHDLQASDRFVYFTAGLGFALDTTGNVGIKLSYERGRIEETGQAIDLTKLALTAKY